MSRYNIERFLEAQSNEKRGYNQALKEIKNGRKTSHWIWYILPQHNGLCKSKIAQFYGISSLAEAKDFYDEPVLKGRLIEILTALYEVPTDDIKEVLGTTDSKKLRSCITLFMVVDPYSVIFQKLLDKYYGGKGCNKTIDLLLAERKVTIEERF